MPHFKQSIQKVREIVIKRLTQILNAIIAIKRVTWLVTVGLKEAERKVTNSNLNDVLYMALSNQKYTKFDWYFDTATTSHICT